MKKIVVILLLITITMACFFIGCGKDNVDTALEFSAGGQTERAIEILDQEIKDNPRNAKALYARGMIAFVDHQSESKFKNYFNSAILLDEGYRDKIYGLVISYVDSAITQQNIGKLENLTEMALRYAPDKSENTAKMLFSKTESSLRLNPIDNGFMVDVLKYAVKYKPSLSPKTAELLLSCGKQIWDKEFSDQASLKMIDKYFRKASEYDQNINDDISNECLKIAKVILAKPGLESETKRFMSVGYSMNMEKGGEIAKMYLEQADQLIAKEDYRSAFDLIRTAIDFDASCSAEAEELRKKIPIIVEDFEDKNNCIFKPIQGTWTFQNGPTGLAYGPSSLKKNAAICSVPFSTGILEYDFNITSTKYADCCVLLDYTDVNKFIRVSICPYQGDTKDNIEIVAVNNSKRLVEREPIVGLNTWNHVRIERTSDYITVYLNGQVHLQTPLPLLPSNTLAILFWDRGMFDNFMISGTPVKQNNNNIVNEELSPVDDFIGLWTAAGGEAEGTIEFTRPNLIKAHLTYGELSGTFELIPPDSMVIIIEQPVHASYTMDNDVLKLYIKGEGEAIYRKLK